MEAGWRMVMMAWSGVESKKNESGRTVGFAEVSCLWWWWMYAAMISGFVTQSAWSLIQGILPFNSLVSICHSGVVVWASVREPERVKLLPGS